MMGKRRLLVFGLISLWFLGPGSVLKSWTISACRNSLSEFTEARGETRQQVSVTATICTATKVLVSGRQEIDVPTNSPIPTCEPTSTPCNPLRTPTQAPTLPPEPTVDIYMPRTSFSPGDDCYCKVKITASRVGFIDYPLFVVLDIAENYFFAPTFSGFDYYDFKGNAFAIGPKTKEVTVFENITWPSGVGNFDGAMWYAAFTNPEMTEIYGGLGTYTFGWHGADSPTPTPFPGFPTPTPKAEPESWDGELAGNTSGWMQTMEISIGQSYSVTADGTVCFLLDCAHDSDVDPGGWCGVDCSNDTYCAVYQNFGDCSPDERDPFIQFSHAALLGFEGDNPPADISSEGDVFLIGNSIDRVASGTGHVWVRINDWRTSDNSGSFHVRAWTN